MNKVRTLARHGPAADFAKGKQPPSYAVVSESELANLRSYLQHDPMQAVRDQKEERMALKQSSEQRVKNWPNLIETIRLKKEKERRDRLDREEDARMQLDQQERDFQSQVRNDAIEKANQMLYKQEDRVKAFTSNLFLASVLDERAKQVEMNRQKKELIKQKEYEWALVQQEQVERSQEEETERSRKRRDEAQSLKLQQKEQLAEVRVRKLHEREEARQEGRQIRDAAERSIEKEREMDEARRQKAIEINKQYIDENRRQRAQREVQLRDEEQELKKIKLFAQLKEEQMLERKKRAEAKFNADLDRRQQMIARQAAHLEAIASEADERVLTQIRDAEKERGAREAADKEKKQRLWESINVSRKKQAEMKESQKQAKVSEKHRIADLQAKHQALLMDEEVKEREAVRKRNEDLQTFQRHQIDLRNEQKRIDREMNLEDGRAMLASFEHEENMFQDYVASVMGPRSTRGGSYGSHGSQGSTPAKSPQPPSTRSSR